MRAGFFPRSAESKVLKVENTTPKQYLINISECNNTLLIDVNGNNVYLKTYPDGASVNDVVDITNILQPPPLVNNVHVRGDNGPHNTPWAFKYNITKDGAVMYNVDERDNTGQATGTKITRDHPLVKE
jgi:hypothetical protein